MQNTEDQAKNWARYWKPEMQRYIHAYLAVTGVDLARDMSDGRHVADRYLQPSVHLRKRLEAQKSRGLLPASRDAQPALTSEMMDYVELPAAPRQRSLRYRDNG